MNQAIKKSRFDLILVTLWIGASSAFAQPHAADRQSYRATSAAMIDVFSASGASGAPRIIPVQRERHLIGLRFFGIRPESEAARLGLRNGDIVRSLNGTAVTTSGEPPFAPQLRLRTSAVINVELERAGATVLLQWIAIDRQERPPVGTASVPADPRPQLPAGWFHVVGSAHPDRGLREASLRFSENEYDLVLASGRAERRSVRWAQRSGAWLASSTPAPFELRLVSESELTMVVDGFELRLAHEPAGREAALNRAIATLDAPTDVCASWEQCCRVAMPLLGAECNVEVELGDRSASTCTNGIRAMREILSARHIEAPGECRSVTTAP